MDIIATLALSTAIHRQQAIRERDNSALPGHTLDSIRGLAHLIADLIQEDDNHSDRIGSVRRTLMSLPMKAGHSRGEEIQRIIAAVECVKAIRQHYMLINGDDVCTPLEIKREVVRIWTRVCDKFCISKALALA